MFCCILTGWFLALDADKQKVQTGADRLPVSCPLLPGPLEGMTEWCLTHGCSRTSRPTRSTVCRWDMYDVAKRNVSIFDSFRSAGSVGMSVRRWMNAELTECVRSRSRAFAAFLTNFWLPNSSVVIILLSLFDPWMQEEELLLVSEWSAESSLWESDWGGSWSWDLVLVELEEGDRRWLARDVARAELLGGTTLEL